jgi:GT2 family glycosyltransferase
MVEVMDARPEFAVFACKIMDFTRRNIFDSLGDGYSRSGLSFKLAAKCTDDGSIFEPFEVFGACAAACIYRKALLDDIGLYDEDFFAYMEDVDLCIRARLAGYRCLAIPKGVVYHVGSATSGGSASAFSVRLTTRNLFAVIFKNMPATLLPRIILTTVAVQAGAVLQAFTTSQRPWLRQQFGAYLKGLGEAITSLPEVLAKRRKTAHLRTLSAKAFSREIENARQMRRAMEIKFGRKP